MNRAQTVPRATNFKVGFSQVFSHPLRLSLSQCVSRTRHEQRFDPPLVSNRILVRLGTWKQHGLSGTGAEHAAIPSAKESEERRLASVVTGTRIQPEQETASGVRRQGRRSNHGRLDGQAVGSGQGRSEKCTRGPPQDRRRQGRCRI